MGIYGHKFDNLRTDLHPEIVQEGVIDAFKSIIESIKKGIVNLIDKINGWLDKHPDSKVAMGLKSILTKLKNLLTKADKIKSKEDAEEVKSEVDKNKEEAENLMKDIDIPGFEVSNFLKRTLENNDAYDIVGAIIGYLNADPWFKTNDFKNAIKYAKSKAKVDFIEEYKEDDRNKIIEDKSKWNEDYYALQRVYLKDNFSLKRIKHVEKVGMYIGNPHGKKLARVSNTSNDDDDYI